MRKIITISVLFILGCSQSESPKETYDSYVQMEMSGITFEQFMASYSKRKQVEIEGAVKETMEKNGLDREQTIEKLLPLLQNFAKCKSLEFLDEKIDGDKATVSYKSTDDCVKGEINIKKEVIYMVNEGGWKIDNNDIQEL